MVSHSSKFEFLRIVKWCSILSMYVLLAQNTATISISTNSPESYDDELAKGFMIGP